MRHVGLTPRRSPVPSCRPRALSRGFFVRRGVTLMEVIVAVAIFLLVVSMTAQILSHAGERALFVEHRSEALHLCQSQLARVIAGIVPLTSEDAFTPLENAPDYQWRMSAAQAELTGLYDVQIWVQHVKSGANSEVLLCQKVFDPKSRGSSADQPGQSTTGESSSGESSTPQTPASGTSGGN